MSRGQVRSIEEVVAARLCSGCGTCAYLSPDRLTMSDVPRAGRRPLPVTPLAPPAGGDVLAACPGHRLAHPEGALEGAPLRGEWGPVLAVYECWATDPLVRHRGSSGGVVTAIASHAIRSGRAVGSLQVRARRDDPTRNETVLNRTPEEVVASTGSRYAPASPCERLDLVENAGGPVVVVGKPCDIAGVRAAEELVEPLRRNVALTIGIFCAGTPTTAGTLEVLRRLGVAPEDARRVDYRGEGWPGRFRVVTRSGETRSCSYEESWGTTLQKHRQWRCMICPDHTGEFADLAVGDPWYRPPSEEQDGRSLVVVRSEAGRAALLRAMADGAVQGHEVPPERLRQAQPNLERTRGAVRGRVLAMRLAGMPVPRYRGLPSARLWWSLTPRAKVSSVVGTWRRIRRRRLREPETPPHPARLP